MIKFICKIIVKNTVKGSKTKEIKGGKSLKYVYKENALVQMKQTNPRKS